VSGPRRGRLPQIKIQVSVPRVLVDRIEEKLRRDGSATSVADFLRQAAVDVLKREGYGALDEAEGERRTIARTRAK
jgi:Arc/MetJ-type ribon-helix-helix transcriptional regulator